MNSSEESRKKGKKEEVERAFLVSCFPYAASEKREM
jgi:hypothetical protein